VGDRNKYDSSARITTRKGKEKHFIAVTKGDSQKGREGEERRRFVHKNGKEGFLRTTGYGENWGMQRRAYRHDKATANHPPSFLWGV